MERPGAVPHREQLPRGERARTCCSAAPIRSSPTWCRPTSRSRRNHVAKPVAWRGQGWTVKNLIELKNAQRVTIDGNIFENNWAAAQQGYAIVLTPRNQDGTAPWTVVQQVEFTNNVVRHVASVFNILGNDDVHPSRTTNDITIRNNLFLDISTANWGGAGRFMLTNGGGGITVDHNTVFSDGTSVLYRDGAPVAGFVFTNNIIPDNVWAVMGTGTSPGSNTLGRYFPGYTFTANVLVGSQTGGLYPGGNFFPAGVGSVGFVNIGGGDYRLLPSSPDANVATQGGAVGYSGPPVP